MAYTTKAGDKLELALVLEALARTIRKHEELKDLLDQAEHNRKAHLERIDRIYSEMLRLRELLGPTFKRNQKAREQFAKLSDAIVGVGEAKVWSGSADAIRGGL